MAYSSTFTPAPSALPCSHTAASRLNPKDYCASHPKDYTLGRPRSTSGAARFSRLLSSWRLFGRRSILLLCGLFGLDGLLALVALLWLLGFLSLVGSDWLLANIVAFLKLF